MYMYVYIVVGQVCNTGIPHYNLNVSNMFVYGLILAPNCWQNNVLWYVVVLVMEGKRVKYDNIDVVNILVYQSVLKLSNSTCLIIPANHTNTCRSCTPCPVT